MSKQYRIDKDKCAHTGDREICPSLTTSGCTVCLECGTHIPNILEYINKELKLCEHGVDPMKCRFCSIVESTQGLIKKDLLLD